MSPADSRHRLDSSLAKSKQNFTEWLPKQKRAYQRLLSGLRYHRSKRLRFMTLTSANNMKRDIRSAWRVLKERIKRLTPLRLLKLGYISPSELRKYYQNPCKRLEFHYFKVETAEGVAGVFHILYFGDFIPVKWLSNSWKEITGSAYIVDIRACKDNVKSPKRLARYCIAQYVSGQLAFVRFSWAWSWVCKGFVKVWKLLVKVSNDLKRAIHLWSKLLAGKSFVVGGYIFKPPPSLSAYLLF